MHGSNDDYDDDDRNMPMHHQGMGMNPKHGHGIMSPRAGYEISPPHLSHKEVPHPVLNPPNTMH
jgi:hypothetical protein